MAASPPRVPNTRRRNDENATNDAPNGRSSAEIYRFGPFRLHAAEGRLFREDAVVSLAPKPFETLTYLVRRPGRVVSKQELLDAVWPGTFVTEDVLVQCVVDIRKALADSAKEPHYIQTLPKRGYLFAAPVQTAGPVLAGGSAAAATAQSGAEVVSFPRPVVLPAAPVPAAGPRRRFRMAVTGLAVVVTAGALGWWAVAGWFRTAGSKPALRPPPGSVAVLPIQMVDDADDTSWLRLGLAEIVASEIAQQPGVQAVPRHQVAAALRTAGFADSDFVPSAAGLQVARELNVQHLVSGSLQRVDDRFTITARIVDVATGRVERELQVRGDQRAGVLEAVARLCQQVATAIDGATGRAAGGPPRSVMLPTQSVAAYRAYTEAIEHEARGSRDGLLAAEAKLREAITADPSFARAYVRLAVVQQSQVRWGYASPDPRPAVREALARVVALPERERLLVEGMGRLLLDDDGGAAVEEWSTLLKLYPSFGQDAGVPTLVADTLMREGRWNELVLVTESLADAPAVPVAERAVLHSLRTGAFRRKGDFDAALRHVTRAIELWPVREGPAMLRLQTLRGRILVDARLNASAVEIFRSVAADPRADVVNVTDAAWGFYMAGRRDEAASTLDKALAIDPGYGNAHHLKGWLALTAGRHEDAARQMRRAYELTPSGFGTPQQGMVSGDLAALYYVGVAEAAAGRRSSAVAAWREVVAQSGKALASDPSVRRNPVRRWGAEQARLLSLARLGQAPSEPVPLANDEITSLLQAAKLYAVQGRADRALEALRQAVVLGAGDLQHLRDDPNFDAIRNRPEFRDIVGPFDGERAPVTKLQ